MALRFQTRLSIAMSMLIVAAVSAMAFIVLLASIASIAEHYRRFGLTVTKLSTRNIEYGASLPGRVMDRVGEQMVVSALMLAELVDTAENQAKLSPEAISEKLKRVVTDSKRLKGYPLIDDLWVTDESGRIYIGANPVPPLQITPDPALNPQSHVFYPLLEPGAMPIVQDFQPRDSDGKKFKYVGVSGVDKPRIIQVGAGEQLVEGIQSEFSVQNVLDRFFPDLDVASMLVVDSSGTVLASVGEQDMPRERIADSGVIRFCVEFLNDKEETRSFQTRPIGYEFGVVTRLRGNEGEKPRALYIQHRTDEGRQLIRSTFAYLFALSAITILVAVLVIMLLSRGLSHPVKVLAQGAREFGKGNLDHRVSLDTRDEMQRLATAFNTMADSLQRQMREIEEQTSARERLESELAIAAEMQRSLLPEQAPAVEGLEVAGWSHPAREVGGDFYDLIPLGPGRIGVAIGDGTGKGLPAALLTSECWSIFRAIAEDLESPAAVLSRTNNALCKRVGASGRFVTMFYMVIDANNGVLRYAQGGHNPPMIVGADSGRMQALRSKWGMPLGVEADCQFEDREVLLDPADTIVLYSDGITEARGADNRLYGEARFCEVLNGCTGFSLEELIARVRSDVQLHTQDIEIADDMTLVALRWRAQDALRGDPPDAGEAA
ncbi:MAG: PP2C family protein-serine/threonine phosphatase [Candidatus Hydrogenedentes bacterium]|nr:PP2C family protein-serine/threonine phosphatase [Candidatus Hydrogenedentota bacterium]